MSSCSDLACLSLDSMFKLSLLKVRVDLFAVRISQFIAEAVSFELICFS